VSATDDLSLRALRPEDETALAELFSRNALPEVVRHFHPFPLDAESARALSRGRRRDRFYVACRGPRIVGLSMLRGWDEGHDVPRFGVLVDRDQRGCGIGSRLLDHAIEQARALGSPRVELSVYASNSLAHGLYLRRGFVEKGRERVQTPFGDDERVLMSKDLQP
jgi:ribosomal protein S18 acetylase RimI-like enzyme